MAQLSILGGQLQFKLATWSGPIRTDPNLRPTLMNRFSFCFFILSINRVCRLASRTLNEPVESSRAFRPSRACWIPSWPSPSWPVPSRPASSRQPVAHELRVFHLFVEENLLKPIKWIKGQQRNLNVSEICGTIKLSKRITPPAPLCLTFITCQLVGSSNNVPYYHIINCFRFSCNPPLHFHFSVCVNI